MTNIGKPTCQKSKSQDVLCRLPSTDVDSNTPGNVRLYGIIVIAVKAYAHAITRLESKRDMANCANRSIAVIESHKNIAIRYIGKNPAIGFSRTFASGHVMRMPAA